MEYRLSNRTLLKSEDGTLKAAQPIENSWGDIDYIWTVDEPGTISIEGDDEIKEIEKPGILIKTYKRNGIPAKLFVLYDNDFLAHIKSVQELDKKEQACESCNECCCNDEPQTNC